MRIIFVWITALWLITMFFFVWYMTQPMVYAFVNTGDTVITGMGENSTRSSQTFSVLLFLNNIWGPLGIILVLVWAIISSQRRDWSSQYQN